MFLNNFYYTLKPLIPRSWQIVFRRQIIFRKRRSISHIWPIDLNAGKPPHGWAGWPDDKRFALALSHDVDTAKGHEKCEKLMDLEKSFGFVSCFNFVPERYDVSHELRQNLSTRNWTPETIINNVLLLTLKKLERKRNRKR